MKLGKWKNITIVILLLSSYISFAQTNIDSLKILLQKSTDVDRVNILNELAESHKRIQPQKTVEYGKEALSLSTSLNNESLIAFSLSNIGDGEMILGNIDTAELYYNKAFNIYDKQQDFLGLSDIYLDLGNIFFFRAYYDSATEYYNKSIGFKIDLNESKGLLSLYNNLGAVYKKTGKYDLAIEAFENAIELSNKFNEPKGKGSVLINLADIYFLKGELSKAMKANYDALKNGKSINDNYTISNAYTNLSEIYSFLEDYQSALEYQKKSLIIDHKLEDWEGIITAYDIIGGIYIELNNLDSAEYYLNRALLLHDKKNVKIDFEKTSHKIAQVYKLNKNYNKALHFLNQSLEKSLELNDIELIIENHMVIGEIFLEKKNIQKAEFHLTEAFKLTKKHLLKKEYKIYSLLSQLYKQKEKYKEALDFNIMYTNQKDSLLDAKRTLNLAEIISSYEFQSQQKKINTLSEISRLQQEKIKKQKAFRNILAFGTTIILILLILYFLNFKSKIKANKILQTQNEEIKNKNIEIKLKTEHLTKVNKDLEKLSIATSKTDNAIIMFDPKGKIEWINEGYTRLYGHTFDDLISRKGETFKDISSKKDIEEIFNKVIAEKKSQIYETDVISNNKKNCKIHTTLTPILNKEDEIVRLIAIDSDITKLKEVEERLQELLVTKDKFFSIIAHDLKNPFNSLIGLSQLLVHGFDRMNTEKVKYFHKNLYQISKNSYELLINLLEWSHSQMGTITFDPVINNLYALTEETFTLYNSKATQKEITLTNNIQTNSEIFADKNMLKTTLRNLVQNALKFTERGGAIEISENSTNELKEIIIRDTGIGIAPENIAKLFRLDENYTTEGTEEEMGTGLGLILCKEFMKKNNGSIKVESKLGFGSQFILTFPLK